MTDVQNDMAWRHQMLSEVQPLDRPTASPSELKFVCRNPLSWNYGVEVKLASSKASSRSKSSLRSSSYASLTSGPARSSLLSMELDHERKMREAMEREVQELKAKLSRMDPSMLPAEAQWHIQTKRPDLHPSRGRGRKCHVGKIKSLWMEGNQSLPCEGPRKTVLSTARYSNPKFH
ncbi:unnamed protein product [Durusdinium trenchii]|uniref:Uncharacterized protein n=1 Tax=Durusdinium trenchii TaxID=1381693 RepID=A0ABP0JZL5_9DINO